MIGENFLNEFLLELEEEKKRKENVASRVLSFEIDHSN